MSRAMPDTGDGTFRSQWYERITGQYIVGRAITGFGALAAIVIGVLDRGWQPQLIAGVALLVAVNVVIGLLHHAHWPTVGRPPVWLRYTMAHADVATIWALTLVEPPLLVASVFAQLAVLAFHATISGAGVGASALASGTALTLLWGGDALSTTAIADPFAVGALFLAAAFVVWVGGTYAETHDATMRELADAHGQLREATEEARSREEEATRRLRELASVRERLLRSIAHQLRTPVTAVQGSLELLTDRWRGLDDERKLRLLGLSMSGADDLARMTEQLLDMLRLEEPVDATLLTRVRLREIVNHRLGRLQRVLNPYLVEIDIDPELEVVVNVDSVDRVLDELLTNVVNHTPPGTGVGISAVDGVDRVHLAVSDTGPGIADEIVSRLGDVLIRPEGELGPRGLGIGLALAMRHADRLGGELTIQAGDDGTTVTVTLPASHPPADRRRAHRDESSHGER